MVAGVQTQCAIRPLWLTGSATVSRVISTREIEIIIIQEGWIVWSAGIHRAKEVCVEGGWAWKGSPSLSSSQGLRKVKQQFTSWHSAQEGRVFWTDKDLEAWWRLFQADLVQQLHTRAQQASTSPDSTQEPICEGTNLWAWPLPLPASNQDDLPQTLSREQHRASWVTWGASPKGKSYHRTHSQDGTHTHGMESNSLTKTSWSQESAANALEQGEPSQLPR